MNKLKIIYEYSLIEDDTLKQYVLEHKQLQKYFKLDFKGLKTQQYCGVLNTNGEDIYLLPKIAKDDEKNLDIFIYMLMFSYDIKLENEDIASC